MSSWKRIVVVVLLAAVISVAVVYTVRSNFADPKPPPHIMNVLVERIDVNNLELITLSLSEWEDLGYRDGKYKNPNTGEYTMTMPIICRSCGAKIPPLDMAEPDWADEAASRAYMEAKRAYRCPRCGGPAY